jgi:hypothetical protein
VRQGVLVRECTEGDPAGLATAHRAAFAKQPKLVTKSRHRQIQQEREIAYTQLRREREWLKDPDTGRIGGVPNQVAVASAADAHSSPPIRGHQVDQSDELSEGAFARR